MKLCVHCGSPLNEKIRCCDNPNCPDAVFVSDGPLKDSGARQEFETGSRRDLQINKGRYDLLPAHALKAIALIMEAGAIKYGDRNWELGQPLSRFYSSAQRHLWGWISGQQDEAHLWQALWNVACLVHTREEILAGRLPAELNDIPDDAGIDYVALFFPPGGKKDD